MIIHYCEFSRHNIIGCVNRQKIVAMAAGKPVLACDSADFSGQRIGPDWFGEYPVAVAVADTPNYDISRYDLSREVRF
jgi:hypothetical protein